MISRALIVLTMVVVALVSTPRRSLSAPAPGPSSSPAPHDTALRDAALVVLHDACNYLWSQQAPDGGWHSETYAYFRSGQALTPFLLHGLLQIDASIAPRPEEGVDRALAFIRETVNVDGVVGLADPDVPEYPNYATAYALRCLVANRDPADEELVRRMRDYLVSEQLCEENGFSAEDPVYGAWGFGGRRPAGSSGHVDVSYTRHVMEALAEAGAPAPVFERAQTFLRYMQKRPEDGRPQPPLLGPHDAAGWYDGGFYFTPVVPTANKGGIDETESGDDARFRSYATATCDGALALLLAGVPATDERIRDARAWITRHPALERAGGIPENDPNDWANAVLFYHLAARAEAYEALHWQGEWRANLGQILAELQREDGSFRNDRNHLMKEDDPLLATGLALIALTRTTPGQALQAATRD